MISRLYLIVIFTIFLFLSHIQPVQAQRAKIVDSLYQVVISDTNQVDALQNAYYYILKQKENENGLIFTRRMASYGLENSLFELTGFAYIFSANLFERSSTPDSVFYYAKMANIEAKKGEYPELETYTLKRTLIFYNRFHKKLNLDSIEEVFLSVLHSPKAAEIYSEESITYQRAAFYKDLGDYNVVMDYSSEALKYFDYSIKELSTLDTSNVDVKKQRAKLSFGIGYQFYKTNYMGRAKTILLDAEKVMLSYPLEISYANVTTVLGAIYKKEGKPDSALIYFQKTLEVADQFNAPTTVAGSYENIGITYKDKNELDKAMEAFNKSLEIRKKLNRPDIMVGLYVNMSTVFVLQGEYKKSEEYLLEALEISENMPGKLETRKVAYQNLSETYAKMNKYKLALENHRKYKKLDDSLTSQRIQKEQVAFDKKLELSEKNAMIEIGKQKNQVLSVKHQKAKAQNIALGAGLLVVLILTYVIYRLGKQRRENERLLFEQKKQEQQSEILKLLSNNEVDSMNSFMKGQEKERSRIASDLHDRLGSLLSTVKLHFNLLKVNIEEISEEHTESMDRTIDLLDSAVEEVRSVSRNLTQGVITQFGLLAAVENLKDSINQIGRMQIEVVEAGFNKRLESELEINLFRVIQEMVTNAVKHAEANEMIIQFVQNEDSINIIIEDDGKGFDSSNIKSNGIGLTNMYNRINEMGASYNLDTSPGNGTTYVIELKF